MPAAVGDEPMPSPMSMEPAAIAVLISAPLPTSLQLMLPFVPSANQPRPFAISVGFVSVKKAMLVVAGTAADAGRESGRPSAIAPAPIPAARKNVRRSIVRLDSDRDALTSFLSKMRFICG